MAALVVAGIWAYLAFGPKPAAAPQPVLTVEAKAYLTSLKLSDVGIQASESFVKQSLVEIVGKISNGGRRTVKLVEVNCVFRDAAGQIIKRERVAVAGRKTGPLGPGDTKRFRLAFDDVPGNWNQAMPDLVIAQILFG
ncbi:MAG: FxLYD domain-containing protein [Acidobacteriota bacterium]|nr:FxLYD domain-containing protein [Acidobacteriota bacterium]